MKSGFDNEQNGVTNVGGEDIGKVKVDAADALGYLGNKLIAGSNISLNASASDITISANVASVAGHQIENEGSQLPLQPTLDFVGTGVHVTNDAGNNKTIVEIEGIKVSAPITDATLNCEAGYHYVCNGVTTANLPAGVQGMVIGFADYGETFAGSPLTITANAGDTIVDDTATTLVLDRNTSTVMLGFCSDRWILLTAETFRDLGVSQGAASDVSDGDKGDVIVSNDGGSWLLDTTAVTPGSYTFSSITVDSKGRITAASSGDPFTSSALTGTPTAPTAAPGTNTTQIATTAFVQGEGYLTGNESIVLSGDVTGTGTTAITVALANTAVTPNTYGAADAVPVVTVDAKGRITSVVDTSIAIAQSAVTNLTTDLAAKAPLASPALTGTPTAPTAVTTTNTTQVATTAFVQQELAALPASATNLGYTALPTDGTVTSSTGTDATLPLVTGVNAGLMAPADFTKVGYITATGAVNLDNLGTAAFLNVGTTANLVVQLDGTGKLPAVDGSLLTNLPSGFADPMTTAGDIIIRNGGNTTARLGIGSEGQILTVTSGVPAWGAVSSSGHTIQDEGTPLTQRTNLNFVGGSVTVTDDAGNDATVVTVTTTSAINWLGAWSNATNYVIDDGVEYQGSSYIANAPSLNKIPGTDTEWDLLAAKGTDGATGSPGVVTSASGVTLTHVATPADPGASNTILYAKTDGKLYFLPTGGSETEVGSGVGLATVATKTTAYTANDGERIPCDTITTGAFTITTPASGRFQVVDIVGTSPTTGFGANNLTITPASGTVMGGATLVLDVGAISPEFELIGTDWRIVNRG